MSFNPEIVIKENDVVDVVLDYLYQHGHLKTMRSLEEETGRTAFRYGKDVMFFRGLVLDGRWEDVEIFIQPLEGLSTRYNEALFYLRQQRFLEMLDKSDESSDLTEVTELLKGMEQLCSQEKFHSLCYCLTLPAIQNHPDFSNWSECSGRLECFTTVVEFLESIFPDQTSPSSRVPANHLTALCKQAVMMQADAYFLCHPDEEIPEVIHADLCAENFLPKHSSIHQLMDRKDSTTYLKSPNLPGRHQTSSGSRQRSAKPDFRQTVQGGLAEAFPPVPSLRSGGGLDDVVRSMDSKVVRPPKPKENESLRDLIETRQKEKQSIKGTDKVPAQEHHSGENGSHGERKQQKGLAWDLNVGDFKGDRVTRPPRDGLRSSAGATDPDHWSNGNNREDLNEQNGRGKSIDQALDREDSQQHKIRHQRPEVRAGGFAPSAEAGAASLQTKPRAEKKPLRPRVSSQSSYGAIQHMKEWTGLVLLRESHPLRAVSFSPNGQYFAMGTNNKVLAVGSAPYSSGNQQLPRTKMLMERADHHRGSVYCLSWDSTSEFIATGSNDKCIKVCAVSPNDSGGLISRPEEDFVLRGHTGTIRDLCFTPLRSSGLILSAGAGDCRPRLWDLLSGSLEQPVSVLPAHTATVFCTRFSEDGSLGMTAGQDGVIKVWDFRQSEEGGLITDLDVGKGAILAASFRPGSNNREIATSHEDGSCQIWDLRQRTHLFEMNNHSQEVRTLQFNLSGELLLTGSFDCRTSLYESVSSLGVNDEPFKFLATLQGHSGRILQASFHPTDPCILTSSADCSIMYWRPQQDKLT